MKQVKRIYPTVLGLLFLPAAWALRTPAAPPGPASTALSPPIRPGTPFERSLRQGWKLRSRALLAEVREREALESWDPARAGLDETTLRSEALARDRSGDLRRAGEVARQAEDLARTPAEAGRAAELLLLIERDLGHRQAERVQSRGLGPLALR